MTFFGKLLTHYRYSLSKVTVAEETGRLTVDIRTPNEEADLHVVADLSGRPGRLSPGSPFRNLDEARRFAGALPFTFDYEPQTDSIIRIQGHREAWNPEPVDVEVTRATYFANKPELRGARPMLANAFYLHDVPYLWTSGVREALSSIA